MKKTIDWDRILIKLQRAYDLSFQTDDDYTLYINIVNYVSFFDQLPELQVFTKEHIQKSAEQDNAYLKKLEEDMITSSMDIFQVLKPYLKDNKVTNAEVEECIKKVPMLYDETLVSSGGKMSAIFGQVNRLLYIAWEWENGKYKGFLLRFGTLDKSGQIKWDLSRKHDEYDVEELKLKRIALTKIWYYWDKLAFYFNLFADYEKMIKEWFEKGRFMTLAGINDAYIELAYPLGLLDRSQKKPISYFFTKMIMQRALRQFHFHFLTIVDDIKGQNIKNIKAIYDHDRKEIAIEGKPIYFRDKKRADLLYLVFKRKNKIFMDDVIKHIEGLDIEQVDEKDVAKYKKNILNYCDGINTRLAKKGFTDFLIFKSNYVMLNPLYR